MQTANPSANTALPRGFADSAAYPALHIDFLAGATKIFEFTHADYTRAAFLDERALGHRPIRGWDVPLASVRNTLAQRAQHAPPVHWLFHIGHCGSTLISRLLDNVHGVLGLREPLPLLELAMLSVECDSPTGRIDPERFADHLGLALDLLGRGFADTSTVLVKPTSVVTHLAPALLAAQPRARAVLLSMRLRDWLALMLRSQTLRHGARLQAPVRIAAWHRLTGERTLRIPMLDDAELLAMSWLCAQLEWDVLTRHMPDRLHKLDFDRFLVDVPASLHELGTHLRLPCAPGATQPQRIDEWLGRYAKDPSQRFDASTRRTEIDQALAGFAREVQRGLDWARERLERLPSAGSTLTPDLR